MTEIQAWLGLWIGSVIIIEKCSLTSWAAGTVMVVVWVFLER